MYLCTFNVKVNIDFHEKMSTKSSIFRIKKCIDLDKSVELDKSAQLLEKKKNV